MRNLYTKRENLTGTGTTTVKDERGLACYFLTGRWGMHPAVLSVYASDGDLKAEIKQRSLGFWPKFELFSDRKLVGSLRRYYGLGTEMLFVKKLNWLILGNSLTFNYKIYHGRRCVLSLHEVELASGNYLELTIADINDEALCLCIVAILDFWAKGGLKGGSKENDPLLNLSYIH